MNSDWVRWIRASLTKHFYDNRGTLQFYADGENKTPDDNLERLELRINGPDILQTPGNFYSLRVVVNMGIILMSNETDLYKMDRVLGDIASKFTPSIVVYKYGVEGNPALGCLERSDEINIIRFGRVTTTNPSIMSAIEATYEIELQG